MQTEQQNGLKGDQTLFSEKPESQTSAQVCEILNADSVCGRR